MAYKKFFATMLMVAILGSIASLIPPIFLQLWGREQAGISPKRILIIIGVMLLSHAIGVIFIIYRERFAKDFNKANLRGMTRDILGMDYDSIITHGPISLYEKAVMSSNSIYAFMTGDIVQIWSSGFVLAAALIIIGFIHPITALILFAIIPFNYFSYRLLNRSLAKRSLALQQDTSAGIQEILSRVSQIDYLKQSPSHAPLIQALEPSFEKIYGSMARINVFAQSVSGVLQGINNIARNVALIFMVYAFTQQSASPYALILFTILLPLYFDSVSTITRVNLSRSQFHVARDFQEGLKTKQEHDGSQTLKGIEDMSLDVGFITLQDKTLPFSAVGSLKKGDIAWVKGASGTGKSTFAKALLKFRPIEGVKLNGADLSVLTNHSLRSRAEYLSQDVAIIQGSLRDNLFFNKNPSPEAEAWFLAEPILQTVLANKTLDMPILENGANLSGGEKQKIALARALQTTQDLLVLDEICSNIDQDSAQAIYRRIDADRDSRITLIISHDDLPDGLANVVLNG